MIKGAYVAAEKIVDARGCYCPKPLLELIRGLRSISVGSAIELRASDPGAETDIPSWVRHAGHDFLGAYPANGYTRYLVRKAHP
jgi:tRNA 2-thiouridine synthesizing protein A